MVKWKEEGATTIKTGCKFQSAAFLYVLFSPKIVEGMVDKHKTLRDSPNKQ
jgi:hypothetical protein